LQLTPSVNTTGKRALSQKEAQPSGSDDNRNRNEARESLRRKWKKSNFNITFLEWPERVPHKMLT
jgi:hypothetical protein